MDNFALFNLQAKQMSKFKYASTVARVKWKIHVIVFSAASDESLFCPLALILN